LYAGCSFRQFYHSKKLLLLSALVWPFGSQWEPVATNFTREPAVLDITILSPLPLLIKHNSNFLSQMTNGPFAGKRAGVWVTGAADFEKLRFLLGADPV
jgi:hypothetical protein